MRTLLAFGLVATTLLAHTAADQSSDFGTYPADRRPAYREVVRRSVYVPIKDGVRLAVDVLLPGGLPPDSRIPAIVGWSRYWRSRAGQQPSTLDRFFVAHGYARVLVDERGSGASFGVERYGKENVADAGQVVEWIVRQPWSNGKVGALGDSYEGGAAERLAASRHPAVRAIIPRFTSFDGYTEDLFPGGILVEPLLKQWSATNRRLDEGKGVRPVDEDSDGRLLSQAIRDHAGNPDPAGAAVGITYRDDPVPQLGRAADAFSPALLKDEIEASNAAVYGWGGWLDGASADSVLNRFTSLRNPQMAVIGPWNHLASQQASPWAEPTAIVSPTPLQQWSEFLRFFDRFLRDEPRADEKTLFYYTMGEERWKATSTWPPAGSSRQRWFLTSDRHMSNLPAPGGVLP